MNQTTYAVCIDGAIYSTHDCWADANDFASRHRLYLFGRCTVGECGYRLNGDLYQAREHVVLA